MRYLVKLKLVPQVAHEERIRRLLQKYGLPFKQHDAVWEVSFEKGDYRLATIQEAFSKMGYNAPPFYEPSFDEKEVDQSEVLHLFIRGLCGKGFAEWAEELGMPAETRVIDKREMHNQDIALTFDFEPVISNRLKDILSHESLGGWDAQPILHQDPQKDHYPPLFHLEPTSELPALALETDLERIRRRVGPNPPRFLRGASPVSRFEALFQRGPLQYRRMSLHTLEDFNRTQEVFGEPQQAHPLLIIAQRTWQVFSKHHVKNVDVEPVIILE